jgi:hypothetical protein
MAEEPRRRHPRFEVKDVEGCLLFRVNVRVINISLNGLRVETTERLRLGKPYALKLRDEKVSVDVEGTVKWCHLTRAQTAPDGSSVSVYEAGLTLDGILTERARELLSFLQDHVILPLEKRILGRFRIRPGRPVDLEYRYDFEVRKLSRTGMLVETHLLPAKDSGFDMEIRLNHGVAELQGRIAFTERVGGTDDDPLTRLGIEFVGGDRRSYQLLTDFISEELEPGGPEAPAPT